MKSLGLVPTKGSGSGWLEKEDGQNEHVIAQLKSTDAESYRIKLSDIQTLEYNGNIAHKLPMFVVQFLQSNDIFILARPMDIPDIAKYIACGKVEIEKSTEIDLSEIEVPKEAPTIKSGNRNKFWKDREKERIKNGTKGKTKNYR